MAASMTPERVRELLTELAARIAATSDGATTIRVVGGAAISLLDPARRATSDVDAVVSGPGDVDVVVAAMAAKHDLPADWFNSAVAMWIPFVGPEDWVEVLRNDNVVVQIGSTAMLLAMKLRASRARDNDDIGFLLAACGVRTVADAQEIYERYHHQEVMSAVAQARVKHWLESVAGQRAPLENPET